MKDQILVGNARDVLRGIPDGIADCCITSPPYYGLRSYSDDEKEIGKEETPEEYIGRLVAVFREVFRVLKPGRCCFLNLGDSYASGGAGGFRPGSGRADGVVDERGQRNRNGVAAPDAKPKDLLMIPARVALALQADGWWVRNACVWYKPNGMPSSVRDRFSNKHESVFLLSNASRYWFDLDAVREPAKEPERERSDRIGGATGHEVRHSPGGMMGASATRNPGDVWTIPTQPYAEAHYAVFPEALVERCLLSGCEPGGTVLDPFCGRGTVPVVAHRKGYHYIGIDLVDWSHLKYRAQLKQGQLFSGSAGRSEDETS